MAFKFVIVAFCFTQALAGFSPMMGGGIMGGPDFAAIQAMATFNKQMGMSQGLIYKNMAVAKKEIKYQLDAIKTISADDLPGDVCATALNAALSQIETDTKSAFLPCSMQTDINAQRLKGFQLKQQLAAAKAAKKACKLEIDPAECLANLEVSNVDPDLSTGPTDVLTKSGDCVGDAKLALQNRINEAADAYLAC